MKHIIIISLILISIKCKSQNANNSIGIGLGNISINTATAFGSALEINSPIYNSKGYFYDRTITRITSPNFYLGKRVYKNLFFRINGNYNYRTSYLDQTGWIIEPEPGFNYDKISYNNVTYNKTLNSNIGFQYNFKLGKLNIYPAFEYASILNWNTYKNYYTLRPYTDKSYVETFKEKNMWHSINVLCGLEYCIRKNISLSYEVGLYHEYFSPISRLSINLKY